MDSTSILESLCAVSGTVGEVKCFRETSKILTVFELSSKAQLRMLVEEIAMNGDQPIE